MPIARTARRRHLTLLFSDLSDATRLAGALEPEQYLDILDQLKRCAAEVLPAYGGTLVDFQGDGLLAMFGFPSASEDDGRQATEAALTLHETVRGIALPLPPWTGQVLRLHSGIHSGLVLLIEGDPAPGRFSLVGDAPNVAARLSDAADRDEILVSATTLGSERHFFDVRDRGPLALQGKAERVATYQVLGRSGVTTRFEARTQRGLTPFVGRRVTRERLDEALADAAARRLRVVSIVGAAGVGKTRLVEEFLRSAAAAGHRVRRGYCESHLSAEPLQPFRQMLRGAQGDRPDGAPDEVVRPITEMSAAAMRDHVAALADAHPLVIFIDDWHWADEATRQALTAIRELVTSPLLIITASRTLAPRDAAMTDAAVLDLPPLTDDEAADAIRALRPDADPFVVRVIQQRSGGNPLFIEELCHSAGGGARRHGGGSDLVPAWLNSLVESRVERLPPQQGNLVRSAAVIGTVVPVWLLERISGCGADHPLVRDLATKDLVYPGEVAGTLRFKHGITRDIVYASVGLHEREALHLRIATLLEQHAGEGEVVEALAYHYQAASVPHLAARYAELAGDKAMAAPALDRARRQYRAALDALERLDPSEATSRQWSAIAERLGLACVYDPTRDQLGTFHRAVELARARGDEAAVARAEYWLGYICYAVGDLLDAIDHLERARDSCRRASAAGPAPTELGALAAQVVATLGQAHAAACMYDLAVAELDEAIAVKRQHWRGTRPAVGLAYSLACKGSILADRGGFAEAHELFAQALRAAGQHDPVEGSILGWRGAVYVWQGQWREALATAERQRAIGVRVEGLYILAMSEAIGGYARWRLDRAPDAIESVRRSARWIEGRDQRLLISVLYGWLAEMMADIGHWDEARAYAARALRRARVGDRFGEALACRALARLPDDRRRRPAEHYLGRALASARARGSPAEEAVTLLQYGQFELGRGRSADATSLLTRAHAAFGALQMASHEAEARQLLALL